MEKDKFGTKAQEAGKEDEEARENEVPADKPKDELSTVFELEGEAFDPSKVFAVLALVDTASKVRKKELPKFFYLKKPSFIIGTGKRANIKVDDIETVKAEHSAIVFKNGYFSIFPQEGKVMADDEEVCGEGKVLINGSHIEIGSARFIFLMTKIGMTDLSTL